MEFIGEVHKVLHEYAEKNDYLEGITRKVADNKVCLATLECNLSQEDEKVLSAMKVLREQISKDEAHSNEKVSELLNLRCAIKEYQSAVVEQLEKLLALNRMILTKLDISDMDINVLNAKCAQALYNKPDNYDLRAEPPIHGVVFKHLPHYEEQEQFSYL